MKRYTLVILSLAVGLSLAACGPGSSTEAATPSVEVTTATPQDASSSNATKAAKQYLATMPFSHDGLVQQLVVGSQFSEADAVAAVDGLNVDWNEQAAKAAKQYLDTMPFSRDGLIQQLVVGSKFTQEQAEFGATQNGL